jgi:hypothetical protein
MTGDAGEVIDQVAAWLVSEGFTLGQELYSDEDFGNWLRVYVSAALSIQIVRERGQWSVLAGTQHHGEFFSIAAWSRCLGGKRVESDSIESQSRFVRECLMDMRTATTSDRSLDACLRKAERELLAAMLEQRVSTETGHIAVLVPPADASEIRRRAAQSLAKAKGLRRRRRRPTQG